MKYRKKPVVIDAVQWTGDNVTAMTEFIDARKWEYGNGLMVFHTLEGDHTANPGDWIIRGVQGEFYPCKPDIFEETYEAVAEWRKP